MSFNIPITNERFLMAETFHRALITARWSAFWARLKGCVCKAKEFNRLSASQTMKRAYLGVQTIPVADIVGSVGRIGDFDGCFRPLRSNLRSRWISVALMLKYGAWEPILVYRVNGKYYVEDGNHRVSVANWMGLKFIEARVWSYESKAESIAWSENQEWVAAYPG